MSLIDSINVRKQEKHALKFMPPIAHKNVPTVATFIPVTERVKPCFSVNTAVIVRMLTVMQQRS